MKIRSAQLRKLIRELASLNEVEYDEDGPMYAQPDPSGEPTPEEDEVLVKGLGGLKIRQIKRGISGRFKREARNHRRKAEQLESFLELAERGAYEQLLSIMPLHSNDPTGVLETLLKTLVDHNHG